MLRRLAVGLAGLAATAITIAGCASGGTNQTLSIGPSIPPQTLYATNSTQNGISIYSSAMAGGGPEYQISTGGTTSGLNGPQYLTFDSSANIFTTNWQPSLKVGGIVEIKAQATGNVLPFNGYSFGAAHPRGIADYLATTASSSTKPVDVLVAAVVDPTQPLSFSSQLQLFVASVLGAPIETIAGPNTGLNVPSGVAFDAAKNVYVTNLQGASVEEFSIPTPSPTPTATATASASPSPSPSVSPSATASATPTPLPSPTATPVNIAPVRTLTSGIGEPTGIAIDGNGGIWVSDQKAAICGCPAILYFAKGATTPTAISGSATKLYAPTDVKVDSSGKIYVADSTPPSGAGVIYVFAANATGNVAPSTTYTSPGTVIGLGLAP